MTHDRYSTPETRYANARASMERHEARREWWLCRLRDVGVIATLVLAAMEMAR